MYGRGNEIKFSFFDEIPFSMNLPKHPIQKKIPDKWDITKQDFVKDPLYWEKHILEKYFNVLFNKRPLTILNREENHIEGDTSNMVKLSRIIANIELYEELNNMTDEERDLIMFGIQFDRSSYVEYNLV